MTWLVAGIAAVLIFISSAGSGHAQFLMGSSIALASAVAIILVGDFAKSTGPFSKGSLQAVFTGSFLFWYALPAIDNSADVFSECTWNAGLCFSSGEISLAVGVSGLFYVVGRAVISLSYSTISIDNFRRERRQTLINALLATIMISYFLWTVATLGNPLNTLRMVVSGLLLARDWNSYGNTGGGLQSSLYAFLQYFAIFSISYSFLNSKSVGQSITVLALFCAVALLIKTFNRSFLVLLVLPLLVHSTTSGRMSIKTVIRSGVVLIGGLSIAIALLNARLSDASHNQIFSRFSVLPFGRNNDMILETALSLRVEDKAGPQYDNFILEHLTILIPRSLFPEKPFPDSLRIFAIERNGFDPLADAGNVFPGLFGYFWLNFGEISLILFSAMVLVLCQIRPVLQFIRPDIVLARYVWCFGVALIFLNMRNLQTGINAAFILFIVTVCLVSRLSISVGPGRSRT